MTCRSCGSENKESRKFCRSCGSNLGSSCTRCGASNDVGDSFCGSCGFGLASAAGSSYGPEVAAGIPKQYNADEITELLSLRTRLGPADKRPHLLSQEEVDGIFG